MKFSDFDRRERFVTVDDEGGEKAIIGGSKALDPECQIKKKPQFYRCFR